MITIPSNPALIAQEHPERQKMTLEDGKTEGRKDGRTEKQKTERQKNRKTNRQKEKLTILSSLFEGEKCAVQHRSRSPFWDIVPR